MRRNLFGLKLLHLIPPVVALAIVGAWNGTQWRSISALETETTDMRQRISATLSAASPDTARTTGMAATAGKPPVDWQKLSAGLLDLDGGTGGIKAGIQFERELMGMTLEEMIAALDEIDGLELSAEARELLETMILDSLIKEDPEYALERFVARIESEPDGVGWQLSSALGAWAKKDLAAATAWFDRRISEGIFDSKTLDGRSETRIQFEAALLESLLGVDPAAVGERLAAIPEDQRREVLQQLPFDELSPEDRKNYAALVRQLVPADERAGSFAHIAGELAEDGGLQDISTFLDSVQATPAERSASARQAAESRLSLLASDGEITRGQVDELRQWLDAQAPGQTDRITGKALAEAAQEDEEFGFAEASEMILDYHRTSGNDDILVAFLEGYSARSNAEEAIHLAELIADENRRAEILKRLK